MGRREEKRACMYTIATEESDGERRHQTRDAAAAPPQDGGRETEEGIKLVESLAPAFPWIVVVDAAGCVCLGVPLLLFLAAMVAGEKAEAMRREGGRVVVVLGRGGGRGSGVVGSWRWRGRRNSGTGVDGPGGPAPRASGSHLPSPCPWAIGPFFHREKR